MPRKRTAQDIVDSILRSQAKYLHERWQRFLAGDETCALTDDEQATLIKIAKLNQEKEIADKQIGVLSGMTDQELDDFYERLDKSLPAPEGSD